jgi:hypothetical protein
MTLQDAVGATAASLALALVLASAWIEWSPSDAASVTTDTMPHVAARMQQNEPGSRSDSLGHGCNDSKAGEPRHHTHEFGTSQQPAYCPLSPH